MDELDCEKMGLTSINLKGNFSATIEDTLSLGTSRSLRAEAIDEWCANGWLIGKMPLPNHL